MLALIIAAQAAACVQTAPVGGTSLPLCTESTVENSAVVTSNGPSRSDSTPTVIRISPPPTDRVLAINGTAYLNFGGGTFAAMSAGRCTYSTSYNGQFYADQDFDAGAGVGVPMSGARPCGPITVSGGGGYFGGDSNANSTSNVSAIDTTSTSISGGAGGSSATTSAVAGSSSVSSTAVTNKITRRAPAKKAVEMRCTTGYGVGTGLPGLGMVLSSKSARGCE